MKHVKGKIVAMVGLGTGYVLGSRAGRDHYDKIKGTAQGVWKDPRVQDKVHAAEAAAKDKAKDAVDQAKATAVDDSDAVRPGAKK